MPTNTPVLPNRTFGVEIEATGITRETAVRVIRAVGIEAQIEGYNHRTREHWKVTTDASVEPGWEVVSPILRGEEGLDDLRKVVSALSAAGARVNRSCGLHVHVGINDLTPNEIAGIVIRYSRFETEIDAFMPQSRRGTSNTYCNTVNRFAVDLSSAGPFTRVNDVLRHQPGRFLKVNLEAYSRQQTIEFRQHSGTCNASKIENWVRFLLHFVQATQASIATGSGANSSSTVVVGAETRRRNTAGLRRNSMDDKLDRVLTSLRDAGNYGLSVSEIANIGGWSLTSVPVYVSRLRRERGANIRKVRYNGRYKLLLGTGCLSHELAGPVGNVRTTTRRAARGVTLSPTDSLYQGIPSEVAGYYAERTAELAGTA